MQPSITIHDEAARAMLGRIDAGVRQAVHHSIWRGAEGLARVARSNASQRDFTAGLKDSIRAEEVGEMHYRVVTGTNYARSVEEGRAPGKMPGTAKGLMEWVKQKTGQVGTALDRTTFLIARAIGRKGIKPAHYMQRAVESETDRIVANVQAAARKAAQEAKRV